MEQAIALRTAMNKAAAQADLDAAAAPFFDPPPIGAEAPAPLASSSTTANTSLACKLAAEENLALVTSLCEQLEDARARGGALEAALSSANARAIHELSRYAERCAEQCELLEETQLALVDRDEEVRSLRRSFDALARTQRQQEDALWIYSRTQQHSVQHSATKIPPWAATTTNLSWSDSVEEEERVGKPVCNNKRSEEEEETERVGVNIDEGEAREEEDPEEEMNSPPPPPLPLDYRYLDEHTPAWSAIPPLKKTKGNTKTYSLPRVPPSSFAAAAATPAAAPAAAPPATAATAAAAAGAHCGESHTLLAVDLKRTTKKKKKKKKESAGPREEEEWQALTSGGEFDSEESIEDLALTCSACLNVNIRALPAAFVAEFLWCEDGASRSQCTHAAPPASRYNVCNHLLA